MTGDGVQFRTEQQGSASTRSSLSQPATFMIVRLKAIEGTALCSISLKKIQSQCFQRTGCGHRCIDAPATGTTHPVTAPGAFLGGAKSIHQFFIALWWTPLTARWALTAMWPWTSAALLTPSENSLALLLHQLHIQKHKQGALWWGTNLICPPNTSNCCCLGPELRVFSICRMLCGVGPKATWWGWGRRGPWDTINQPLSPKLPSLDNANNFDLTNILLSWCSFACFIGNRSASRDVGKKYCSQVLMQWSDQFSLWLLQFSYSFGHYMRSYFSLSA